MPLPFTGHRWLLGRSFRRTLRRAGILALLTLILFGLWLRPVIVRGRSMEPTLASGAVRVATRWWTDSQRRPIRGEIVIIRRAGGRVFYLKRILGLPNETIAFEDGRLIIDDEPVAEPYRSPSSNWTMHPITLGADDYFVAGDNRSMPMADHAAGLVNRHNLAGRLWP